MVTNEDSIGDANAFTYDDGICRSFALATLIWGLIGTLAGIFVWSLLLRPDWFPGYPQFAYGRMRPLFQNLLAYGFVANAAFTAIYYSTQRLCKTRMWSGALSWLHFLSWQAIVVAVLWTLGHGVRQPREFAELEWPIDLAIAYVWIMLFAVNFLMTLAVRRERRLFISLWFYTASILLVGIVHLLGNVVFPTHLWKSEAMLRGIPDAVVQAWHRHQLFGYLLMVPFVGAMYYFVPKAADRPVYSYRLAILQFWAFVGFYGWTSLRGLQYAPIADLAGSLAVVFGLMLWMPLWGGVLNGLMILRGAWKKVASEPALQFFLVGIFSYAVVTLEDSWLSIRGIGVVFQYTDFAVGHRDLMMLGWNGMMTFGMIYWLVPRLIRTEIWSPLSASIHLILSTAGLLFSVIPLYWSGLRQGAAWLKLDPSGQLANPEFSGGLERAQSMWVCTVFGLALFGLGIAICLANLMLTWLTRPRAAAVETTPATSEDSETDEVFASGLEGAPVLALAIGVERMATFSWHRSWERDSARIVGTVLLLFAVPAVFLVGPALLSGEPVPSTSNFQPLKPLELLGHQIYVAEGCYSCHTQHVRPLVAETKRYGEFSRAEEFAFDRPSLIGHRRIGPDLAREGGKNASWWHWQHFDDPRGVTKESVMPSFAHLLHERIDYEEIAALIADAHSHGIPYSPVEMETSEQLARQQAERITAEIVGQGGPVMRGDLMTYETKVIALIAYVQRLGTDLFASPKKPTADEAG